MTFGIFDIERRAMSIYGYCRISTAKQSIDRQVRNIRAEYPTAHIVQEAYTGTSILRPEWSKLYRILKEGDLNTVDNEIADESSLIFEFLIGNENYTDWQ